MRKNGFFWAACRICFGWLAAFCSAKATELRPNIIFVLCDDLGYGDVHCMAPDTCKIPTPAVDRLASEGMIFTDAHTASSVCTPSRYALLTGRYAWRTRLQEGVVGGFAPSLIDKDRATVAGFLKSQGYTTAIMGKWHLDFQYLDPATGNPLKGQKTPPALGTTIPDGPVSRGFDYYLGFHHARNMKAVIENDKVIAHDEEINMLPRLTRAAVGYIEAQAKDQAKPFFLYLPLNSPHTPIVPSAEWQGKSPLGPYGDFVMQTDATLGAVLDALERTGLDKNTIVIFSSDNGCSAAAGIPNLQAKGHFPSARFRGSKADLWDGGHRVPFIVRWPGHVASGSKCDQTICLVDFFATLGDMLGAPLPAHAAEDSMSFLPALSGKPVVSTRAGIVNHSISGHFGYREGKWKLLLSRGSGGWSSPKENQVEEGSPEAQLYDMEADPGETTNLYASHPEVAKRLLDQLTSDIQHGRSTAGPDAENDTAQIVLWKNTAVRAGGGATFIITNKSGAASRSGLSAATITTGDATGTNWSGTTFRTITPNAISNVFTLKQNDTNGIVQSFTATSNMTVGTISILASRLSAGMDFVVEVYQFLPGDGGAGNGANPDRFRLYDPARSTLLKSYSLNSAVDIKSGVKGATQLNIILDEAERFDLIAGNAYGIRIRSATTTTSTATILNWDYQAVTPGDPTPYAGGTYGVPMAAKVSFRDLGLALTAIP